MEEEVLKFYRTAETATKVAAAVAAADGGNSDDGNGSS